jgi:hypothetical protein
MNPNLARRLALSSTLFLAFATSAALTVPASAQDVKIVTGSGPDTVGAAALVQTKATVIGIDIASLTATLRGMGGRVFDVHVSPEVGDIGKLRIGDSVDIAYHESLVIHADKVKSNGIRERIDSTEILPASGGVAATAQSVQVLATIVKVDVKKRLLTLRGPLRTGTVKVGPDVSLEGLKVGDSIRAEYIVATAVKVTRSDPAAK